MTRGPRTHRLSDPTADGPLSRAPAESGPWVCNCGASGDGATVNGLGHLAASAAAAFRRLNNRRAHAIVSVTAAGRGDDDAAHLLYNSRAWSGNPALRPFMHPFYDGYGTLSARMDWTKLAAQLEAGAIDAEPEDRLVLRIAVSLAGVPITLSLAGLWRLDGPNARNVRGVLLKQLPTGDDEGPS